MGLTVSPLRPSSPLSIHQSLIQVSDNWSSNEADSFFQKIGCIKSSDDQFVVRVLTSRDEQEIKRLAEQHHPFGESFSIVQQSECYVNQEMQRYYVLSSSTSIFSSRQLKELKETINSTQFLPAARSDQGVRYFAPDILHVTFSEAWDDSRIQRWADGLGLTYHEHKFPRGLYGSAVVYLPQDKNIVSFCNQIQWSSEVRLAVPHELPIQE